MKQQLHFVTLGVSDLKKMKAFYVEKFGWKPMKETDGIVFFQLNGIILGLFPAEELAADIGIPGRGEGFKKFSLAINFNSEEEVDVAFREMKDKGVEIVKGPERVFWGGYSGYVADADGNHWELAFNPFLEMDINGKVLNHK